jgi:hypothetical protein
MHPGLILGATVSTGALVIAGAYAYTTSMLGSGAPSASATTVTSGPEFMVATCVSQASWVRVADAICIAQARHAARAGTAEDAAEQTWLFVASSSASPAAIPPVGSQMTDGAFTAPPGVARYTQDALDVYGRPSLVSTTPDRVLTAHGPL